MTKEKSRYIIGMLLSAVGNLFGMAASLVTIMVAARIVTKEELGSFFLVLMVIQFASVLGDLGMRNTTIQALSGTEAEELEHTSHYMLTMNLFVSVLAMFIVTASLPLLYRIWPYAEFERHAWLAAPAAFLMINFQMANSLLVGARRFGVLSTVNGGIEVLRAILSIVLLFAGLGVAGLIWSLIISRVVGIVLIWLTIPSQFSIAFRHPRSGQLLRFGIWLYGCSVVSVITMRAADTLLVSYMGPAALAIYSAAMQLPRALQRVFESIRPVVLGYVSMQARSGASLLVSEMRVVSGLLALGAAVLLAVSEPLMTLLYSKEYGSGVDIMRILSVWIVVSIINYYLIISLIGKGSAREAFIITLPQVMVMLVATVLLVPRFGGQGAAVAMAVTAIVGNFLACYFVVDSDRTLFRALSATLLRAIGPPSLMCLLIVKVSDTPLVIFALLGVTIIVLLLLGAVNLKDWKNLYLALKQ